MSSPLSPEDRIVVALDVPSAAEAAALVDRLGSRLRWVKVGMELYYAAGPEIVSRLRDRGLNVFLDLKLHDIPNTVASAVHSVASLGASLLTVHACGGPAMLAAARDAATGTSIRLLAVTVLTSMDLAELSAVGLSSTPERQVSRLAGLAVASGIDGLVCSPQEVPALREQLGTNPLLVVPGIRPAGSSTDDQRRTSTPAEAVSAGASMLVIGRPITRSADPAGTFNSIIETIYK